MLSLSNCGKGISLKSDPNLAFHLAYEMPNELLLHFGSVKDH